ncbi:MAG: hypothetical protein QN187_17910 [Armatimonadota bacterium]|nr:hypothetical protein [Armatimonadota bacterium]
MTPAQTSTFRRRLAGVLNEFSAENGSNTPDHVLASYLLDCLDAFDRACHARAAWYGHQHEFDGRPGHNCDNCGKPGSHPAHVAPAVATAGCYGK